MPPDQEVYSLLETSNIDAIRSRIETLPFVVEDLMTLDYDEIYENRIGTLERV